MSKIKEIFEAKIQESDMQVDCSLESLRDALQDMQECIMSDEFDDYSYLEETCEYYEKEYLEAAKKRHKYLITSEGLV